MLPLYPNSYEDLYQRFKWQVPEQYNIGFDACGKWAESDPDRLALIYVTANNQAVKYSFGQIYSLAGQLGQLLQDRGVQFGDRVAVLLPQAPETAFTHIACYRIGAIALPLFTLFGIDAIKYRLADSGTKVVITDADGAQKIAAIREELPNLKYVFSIDGAAAKAESLYAQMRNYDDHLINVKTDADDPAVIIYTSGTTGQPKGALHAHRILLGHLPGVEMSHNLFPQAGDRIWTPADWAWIGGLFDVLMPAWHHGIAVVAHRFQRFDPEAAFQLMQDYKIKNTFLPPTALKMMRAVTQPEKRWQLGLRSVASGGESLSPELLDWGRKVFGLTVNQFYGQTECNMTVSSCEEIMPTKPGAIGKAVPGHEVAIIDTKGNILPAEQLGHIAVRRPNPVMFLRYWNNEKDTADKFIGHWLITGDMGRMDEEGYIYFSGRDDDVIISSGYRIGPTEIEDCILNHPAVHMVAVVGAPDPERNEIVVAVVVPNKGFEPSDALVRSLQEHVKKNLAAYQYPREIYFTNELPLTTTSKVIRKTVRDQVAQWRSQNKVDSSSH